MAIKFPPAKGSILICDFHGTVSPEIAKRRPVIVVSGANKRHGLVTVVPLSTTIPEPIRGWHCLISTNLPKPFNNSSHAYAKCDLVMSVSYERLNLFFDGKDENGKRKYLIPQITNEEMLAINDCIKEFLGI